MLTLTGARGWLVQRFTAVVLLILLPVLFFSILNVEQLDYQKWQKWVGSDVNSALILVTFLTLLVHSWIGVRDVILDYINSRSLQVALLGIVLFALSYLAVWLFVIMAKIL